MNLRDELDRIADRAPALDDQVADTALTNARRRRRRVHLPIAVAAAVAIAILGSAVVRPSLLGLSFEPSRWGGRVEIPATAGPLPTTGVGPARMAYLWRCPESRSRHDCVETRVVTADGRHWRIPDATPLFHGEAGVVQTDVVTLSPDGHLLVYSKGRDFIGRDLLTGKTETFKVFGRNSYATVTHATWSPDSRRLALCLEDNDGPSAWILRAGDVTGSWLGPEGCALGLPRDEGTRIPVNTPDGSSDIPLAEYSQKRPDPPGPAEIPASVVGERDPAATYGMVSPDGGKLALVRDTGTEDFVLDVIGIDPPKRLQQVELDSQPTMAGWLDESRVAIVAERLGRDSASLEPNTHDVTVVDASTGKASLFVQVVGTVEAGSISIATDQLR